jgi:hypothetical protein
VITATDHVGPPITIGGSISNFIDVLSFLASRRQTRRQFSFNGCFGLTSAVSPYPSAAPGIDRDRPDTRAKEYLSSVHTLILPITDQVLNFCPSWYQWTHTMSSTPRCVPAASFLIRNLHNSQCLSSFVPHKYIPEWSNASVDYIPKCGGVLCEISDLLLPKLHHGWEQYPSPEVDSKIIDH